MRTPSTAAHATSKSPRYPRSPRLKLTITKELFEQSRRSDSSHCMIAEAVQCAYPLAKSISVDLQTIRFSDRDKRLRYIYLTPRLAQIGIIEFDQGHEIEPFSITLTGGHVIPMYDPKKAIRGIEIDPQTQAPREITKFVKKKSVEKMNLAKQGLRITSDTTKKRHGSRTCWW